MKQSDNEFSIPKRLIPIRERQKDGDEKRKRKRLTLFTERNAPRREERSPPEIIFEEFLVRAGKDIPPPQRTND